MTFGQVLAVLGILAGGGGIGTALIASRTTTKVESAKQIAVDNAQQLDVQKLKLDGFTDLVHSLQVENDRKDRRIEALEEMVHTRDARIEDLQRHIDPGRQAE